MKLGGGNILGRECSLVLNLPFMQNGYALLHNSVPSYSPDID